MPTFIRQYKSVCNQWTRYSNMMDDRVNKRIFNFCEHAVKIGTIELQNIYPAMVAQTIFRGNTDLVVDKCSILCLSI